MMRIISRGGDITFTAEQQALLIIFINIINIIENPTRPVSAKRSR